MRKDSQNFVKSASYDIKTAEAMFTSGRYIYVIFMCHLAVEKMLKAIVAETIKEMPPRTHSLIALTKLGQIEFPKELFEFISKINNVSVVTRYPEDFVNIARAYPKDVAEQYLILRKKQ